MSRRRWPWVAGAAVLVVLGAVAVPGVRAGLKAPGTLGEALGLPVPRPIAPPVTRREVTVGRVLGDRYDPGRGGPPVVFLPGATPAGRDDSRAVAAAMALARAGRTVFVPELDLYRQEIGRADVEAIAAAGAALADEAGGDVVLAGFSFGGSFALLAAAEEVLADRVAVVAVLGAYWDMAGFAQAAATGRSLVDGREVVWEPDPRAPGLLREQVVALAPPALAPQVAAALEDGPTPEDDGAAALVALAEHDDPRETAAIVAGLPPEVRERLAAVSPSAVAGRIRAPVVAIHDVDDPAVPYAESLRMARDLPGARVTAVELFQHVDLDTDRSLRELSGDLLATWRWTRAILAPQERPFGGLRPLEG